MDKLEDIPNKFENQPQQGINNTYAETSHNIPALVVPLSRTTKLYAESAVHSDKHSKMNNGNTVDASPNSFVMTVRREKNVIPRRHSYNIESNPDAKKSNSMMKLLQHNIAGLC